MKLKILLNPKNIIKSVLNFTRVFLLIYKMKEQVHVLSKLILDNIHA